MSNARKEFYLEQASSANTRRAYATDWNDFVLYCQARNLTSLPTLESTIEEYLMDSAEHLKIASIQRRYMTIRKKHEEIGIRLQAAEIEKLWNGIKRCHGTRQNRKHAVGIEEIRDICKMLPVDLNGKLTKAILLIGFCGAFRRSELCALNIEDLAFDVEGIKVLIRKSKTDQNAEGRYIGIPYGSHLYTCPVRSLQSWIKAAGISEGALFRTVYHKGKSERIHPNTIARILKRVLTKIFIARGFPEYEAIEKAQDYAGHSLRAGFVTSAAKAGVPEHQIRKQTGHSNSNMLQRYIRDAEIFKENPASKIGL